MNICLESFLDDKGYEKKKKKKTVPREGNGNPFQCSYLKKPMDRGALQATVHEVSRVRHNLETKPTPHVFFKS